jgi:3-deoxy-manno-octulosonate cytidylyltransferase (CMP-KDO synthetase)
MVVVATDDDRIAETVDKFGGTAIMTSGDHLTGTDRLAEVAAAVKSDLLVNIQGDLPLIDPVPVDATIRQMQARPSDVMGTLRRRIIDPEQLQNPSVVKVVVDQQGYALYFSRACVPFTRTGTPPPIWKHIGLYVYRREFLLQLAALSPTPLELSESLEQLRALEHGFRIGTVETTWDTVEVDTPADLEKVQRLVAAAAHA